MFVKPNEMKFSDKKFSMIIYGAPGVGKTTLALSAPSPVLIDFDRGISRVKAYHRQTTIKCNNYEDVLRDMRSPEMAEFETVIIDTGGSFVTFLQDWAMRKDAVNRQKNGSISQKGFGAVKQEFQRFSNEVRDTLNKNVIYIFHSVEEKDADGKPIQRLLCEGAARNIVWQPCDFGGYVQMIGTDRVISFTPTQEYFAKGCFGVEGTIPIPTLGATDRNVFLTTLFDRAHENIEAESDLYADDLAKYEAVMAQAREIADAVTTADEATAAVITMRGLEHALTSKKESSALLSEKAKAMGFKWDKIAQKYVAVETAKGTPTDAGGSDPVERGAK